MLLIARVPILEMSLLDEDDGAEDMVYGGRGGDDEDPRSVSDEDCFVRMCLGSGGGCMEKVVVLEFCVVVGVNFLLLMCWC